MAQRSGTPSPLKENCPQRGKLESDSNIVKLLTSQFNSSSFSSALRSDLVEVKYRSPEEIVRKLDEILNGHEGSESSFVIVPSRGESHTFYEPKLERIVLKKNGIKRYLNKIGGVGGTWKKRLKEQDRSDEILEDVACLLDCTRSSLNVLATEKGLVIGNLQYQESGFIIDCEKLGNAGKSIPPDTSAISNMKTSAKFILLVEKYTVFSRLVNNKFMERFWCIVITGKGEPDVGTRLLISKEDSTRM